MNAIAGLHPNNSTLSLVHNEGTVSLDFKAGNCAGWTHVEGIIASLVWMKMCWSDTISRVIAAEDHLNPGDQK